MSVVERQVARHKARNLYYPNTAASKYGGQMRYYYVVVQVVH
jgi:hypothetical protein